MTSPMVLVDLRACQFNGDRGIPAYAQSLTAELIRRPTGMRWLLLRDPRWPLPSRADELGAHASWCTVADLAGPHPPPIDAVFRRNVLSSIQACPYSTLIAPPSVAPFPTKRQSRT